jgi:hypothetical protein
LRWQLCPWQAATLKNSTTRSSLALTVTVTLLLRSLGPNVQFHNTYFKADTAQPCEHPWPGLDRHRRRLPAHPSCAPSSPPPSPAPSKGMIEELANIDQRLSALEAKFDIFSNAQKQDSGTAIKQLPCHDDRPFIVLTETKTSNRHIPVWARYSPLRTRVEAHANTLSP